MTHPHTSPDREAELRRITAVTCEQDRGENPFAWSDLPAPTRETAPSDEHPERQRAPR